MAVDDFYTRVTGQIAGMLARRQAPWLRSWSAHELRAQQPFNPLSTSKAPYGGLNALLLQTHAFKQGYADPRFVTARQAQLNGWTSIASGEMQGIELLFVRPEATLDVNTAPQVFTVHHVSSFHGAPPLSITEHTDGPDAGKAILEQSGIKVIADQTDRAFFSADDSAIHMPPRSSFADDSRYYATAVRELAYSFASRLDSRTDLAPLQHHLRSEIASLFIGAKLGLGHEPGSTREEIGDWIKLMQSDRLEIVSAATDAQQIAQQVLALGKQSAITVRPVSLTETVPARSVMPMNSAAPAPAPSIVANAKQPQARMYLAVPYAEISEAKKLGARFDGEQRVWWIDAAKNTTPFARWIVTDATLAAAGVSTTDVLAEFENALRDYGLVVNKSVVDDGKWHYVPTELSKGSEKNGAYVLDMDGIPSGYIKNFKTSEGGPWKYNGGRLTSEQRAAREAQAREHMIVREREIALAYQQIATACEEHFSTLPQGEQGHPYLERKGVGSHGVKAVAATAIDMGKVLNLPDFARDSGSWLIVPGRDVDGKIWTLQAIHSSAAGPKLFTKDARKKGAFHIVGATDLDSLAKVPVVAFAEGYATGASIFEATGVPVVIAFDAGNLPEVVKAVSSRLPASQQKIICADNDQFFADKIVGRLVETVKPEPSQSASLVVFSGGDGQIRDVPLCGLRNDGEWHATGSGKYRLSVTSTRSAPNGAQLAHDVVTAVNAEFVDAAEKSVRLSVQNGGVVAATKAAEICGALVVVPAFADLSTRPTDFNDLRKLEGEGAVRQTLLNVLSASAVLPAVAAVKTDRRKSAIR